LALRLPNKLTTARSVPDAFSAHQEWLDEWMRMFGEDTRRLVSDGHKLVDTGVRCFARRRRRKPIDSRLPPDPEKRGAAFRKACPWA
jgi:hypothetical protein